MATPHRPRRPGTSTARVVPPTTTHLPAAGGTPLLCTPAEAAQRLRVRESWLRKKAAARQIPCTFLGKHLRFSPTDLAAIITAAARPATGPRRRRRGAATIRGGDLPRVPESSVDPPDREDHTPDGSSSPWPG